MIFLNLEMGIQVKLFFSENKEQLNVIIEDYDRIHKKVVRTLLDVMVDLESSKKNVSDIDCYSTDDLHSQNNFGWSSNDLEEALGEELGIEISKITENAVLCQDSSSNEKSDSAIAAVVSMAEKCSLTDKEEEILIADSTDTDNTNSNESNKPDDDMIEATVLDEDTVLNITNAHKNNDAEKTQNDSVITDNRSENEDKSCPPENINLKDLSVPSTSGTSTEKKGSENPKSPNEKARSCSEIDECDFVLCVEEILDFDSVEEIDSVGDGSDKHDDPKVIDLIDLENVDPHSVRTYSVASTDAESCCSITVVDNFSDDDDEVCSQYSSARSHTRRRTESDAGLRSSDGNFVPLRRAMSNPPEDYIETIYDDDYDDHIIPLVDLTNENEFVDLTESAATQTQHPIVMRRSSDEVMNRLRNFYSSNKDMIAAKNDIFLAFLERTDKKKSGIEAPPKLNNCLPHRKRCSTVTHESDIKFTKTRRPSSVDERNENTAIEPLRQLNRNVPKPTYGPAGFRINDDLAKPMRPKLEESTSRDPRFAKLLPNRCGRTSELCDFRKNRRYGRIPLARHWRRQGSRSFDQNEKYISPLRRQNNRRKSPVRVIQPTPFRGEVWLDLK